MVCSLSTGRCLQDLGAQHGMFVAAQERRLTRRRQGNNLWVTSTSIGGTPGDWTEACSLIPILQICTTYVNAGSAFLRCLQLRGPHWRREACGAFHPSSPLGQGGVPNGYRTIFSAPPVEHGVLTRLYAPGSCWVRHSASRPAYSCWFACKIWMCVCSFPNELEVVAS